MTIRHTTENDAWFEKDPAAILDYTEDWGTKSDWLATGETISSATVTGPTGITVEAYSNTTTTVTAWVSGGTAGRTYDLVYTIVTSASRTDVRRLHIRVKER